MLTRTRQSFRFWGMVGSQRHSVASISIKGVSLGKALHNVSFFRPVAAIIALLSPYTWAHPGFFVPLLAIVGVMGYSLFQAVVLWRDPAKMERFEMASSEFAGIGGKTKKLFWLLVLGAIALVATFGVMADPGKRATFVCELLVMGTTLYLAGWLSRKAIKDDLLSDEERSLIGIRAAIDYISAGLIVLAIAVTVLWVAIMICLAVIAFYLGLACLEGYSRSQGSSSSSSSQPIDFFGGDSKPEPKKTWTSPDFNVDGDGRITEKYGGGFLGRVDQEGRVSDASGWYQGKIGSDGKIRK